MWSIVASELTNLAVTPVSNGACRDSLLCRITEIMIEVVLGNNLSSLMLSALSKGLKVIIEISISKLYNKHD